MRIRTIAMHVTEDDYLKLTLAADIWERRQRRPRQHGSVKDFISETALDVADQLIAEDSRKRGVQK